MFYHVKHVPFSIFCYFYSICISINKLNNSHEIDISCINHVKHTRIKSKYFNN